MNIPARHDDEHGRWMRLESVVRADPSQQKGRGATGGYRRYRARVNKASSWVVCIKGVPEVGQEIAIRKTSGTTQKRYVQAILIPAARRADGRSIVSVSKSPVVRQHVEVSRTEAASPPPPPTPRQRNPRICENCDGPCRVGAGLCDRCRRSEDAPET